MKSFSGFSKKKRGLQTPRTKQLKWKYSNEINMNKKETESGPLELLALIKKAKKESNFRRCLCLGIMSLWHIPKIVVEKYLSLLQHIKIKCYILHFLLVYKSIREPGRYFKMTCIDLYIDTKIFFFYTACKQKSQNYGVSIATAF